MILANKEKELELTIIKGQAANKKLNDFKQKIFFAREKNLVLFRKFKSQDNSIKKNNKKYLKGIEMYIIFGKKMCSGCQEAKRAFEADGLNFKYIDLDNMTIEEKIIAAWYEALKNGVVLPYIVDTDAEEFGKYIKFLIHKMPK